MRVESFAAAQGEAWLVLGASGCGKTTLLHLLGGLLRPAEGEVIAAGENLAALQGAALDRHRGRAIGIVPQKLHLVASLNVGDNLRLAQYLAGVPASAERVNEVLAGVGLVDRIAAFPHQLSHGQLQRVALARGVINRPRLLLADEPTANLDDANCALALDLLQSQALAAGATLLIATHDLRARSRIENQFVLPR